MFLYEKLPSTVGPFWKLIQFFVSKYQADALQVVVKGGPWNSQYLTDLAFGVPCLQTGDDLFLP